MGSPRRPGKAPRAAETATSINTRAPVGTGQTTPSLASHACAKLRSRRGLYTSTGCVSKQLRAAVAPTVARRFA
jgi:hypothetical protein